MEQYSNTAIQRSANNMTLISLLWHSCIKSKNIYLVQATYGFLVPIVYNQTQFKAPAYRVCYVRFTVYNRPDSNCAVFSSHTRSHTGLTVHIHVLLHSVLLPDTRGALIAQLLSSLSRVIVYHSSLGVR